MVEADRPGKLFIGGLNRETTEKTLKAIFGKYGRLLEVILIKDRHTKKSRGFAFITFKRPKDAKVAVKDMNGKSLDGKAIKVEQANKPSFESGGRRRPPVPQRNRGRSRSVRYGRSGGARQYPSRRRHSDDGVNHNMSSSRGRFPVKRGPSSRSGGPPPKRSALSSNSGQGPVSRGRENYGGTPHREPVSSRRQDCVSPRNDSYSTRNSYSSRDYYQSSQVTKVYAPPPRSYAYRNYGHSSSGVEHSSRGYSERHGYFGSGNRDYSGHLTTGGSYGDSYESYGSSCGSRVAPPARAPHMTYGGISRCNNCSGTRDGYGGSRRESYSSNQNDTYSSVRERSNGRRERGLPSTIGRVYSVSRELCRKPRCGASRVGHRRRRSEVGGRSRY